MKYIKLLLCICFFNNYCFTQHKFSLDIGQFLGVYQYQRYHFQPQEKQSTYWSNSTALSGRINYHIPKKWLFSLGGGYEWMPYTIPIKGHTSGEDFEPIRIRYTNLDFNALVGKTFGNEKMTITPTLGFSLIITDPFWKAPEYIIGATSTLVTTDTGVVSYFFDYHLGNGSGSHENILLESGVVGEFIISKHFSIWWQCNFRLALLRQSLFHGLVYRVSNDSNGDIAEGSDTISFSYNGFRLGFGLRYFINLRKKHK